VVGLQSHVKSAAACGKDVKKFAGKTPPARHEGGVEAARVLGAQLFAWSRTNPIAARPAFALYNLSGLAHNLCF
jgi:hypothetical protein